VHNGKFKEADQTGHTRYKEITEIRCLQKKLRSLLVILNIFKQYHLKIASPFISPVTIERNQYHRNTKKKEPITRSIVKITYFYLSNKKPSIILSIN